jgi:threonine/homoserine/homoserine lactone efflux protein
MGTDVWLSFIVASMVLCFSPGPTVFMVMGHALNHGKASVIPLVAGVLCGDVIAMSVSFAGLGALLATSAVLFTIFKWVAAGYLIYLGVKAWRRKGSEINMDNPKLYLQSQGKMFKQALIVTALNPKGIIFFIAFFPLFINTQQPALAQILTMAISFLMVSALSATCYSLFSGYLRSKVKSASFQQGFNKLSGSMLIGAGAVTFSLQK